MIGPAARKHWKHLIIATLALLLGACTSTKVQDYAGNKPAFALREFFNGKLTAHGVLKNRSGTVTRYFTATLDASWNNGIGTLAERFTFNDGEIQTRTWTLTPTSEGRLTATAGDVIGTGHGQTQGNALLLNYVLEVDYKGKKLELDVEDWMWRVDEKTVINQSTLRKWGFTVGTIQLAIIKQ